MIELEMSSATAKLAGNTAKPAVSSVTAAGVIPASQESPRLFCANIRQLLLPPEADPKKLKPKKFPYRSGPVKQREQDALEKERTAVKLCDIANAQREKQAELQAGIAKKPENAEAKVRTVEYLENQSGLLEKMALALFLEAKALREKNAETGN